LPWATTSADNLTTQPYKFNGCEFIEMHGLDATDLGNRSVQNATNQFTSMDRFCEKFPWQSPYVLAGNNPVNYVDVLGDSIWINYGTGFLGLKTESLKYVNGKLYNKDDSAYSGEVKGILKNTTNALNKISAKKEGGDLVSSLVNSTEKYTFNQGITLMILEQKQSLGIDQIIKVTCQIQIALVEETHLLD